MIDDRGNEIHVGDGVTLTGIDGGGTAPYWLMWTPGVVVGLARTRVRVDFAQESADWRPVPAACVRVTSPIDGRTLITADGAWAVQLDRVKP